MSELLANIRQQPQVLADIARYLRCEGRAELESAATFLRSRRQFAIVAMGGSRYAAMPVATYLARFGVDVRILDAGELLYYQPMTADSAVVLVSRSGRTAELVKLAEQMDRAAISYVAVTNCPDSPMARHARVTVRVACEADQGVSARTFTGAVLTLLYLGAAVAGRLDELHRETLSLLPLLAEALPKWEAEAATISVSRSIYLLARGYSLAAACEGCLLFQEVARHPAGWYNAAEFRQGPIEALGPEDVVFVFAPDGPTRELNHALARDLAGTGAKIHEIGPAWPGIPEHLAAVTGVIPMQLAAHALAVRSGIHPGEFQFAAATTEAEKGLSTAP
jgi:glutamine---fructose-6-phosphate transaminase (isomerizing)